jgi:hypothetical protein
MSASVLKATEFLSCREMTRCAKTRRGDYLLLADKDEATKTEEATVMRGPSGRASLWNTASLPRGGELLRQAIQHAEYGFNAVAGEECQRRCPE